MQHIMHLKLTQQQSHMTLNVSNVLVL